MKSTLLSESFEGLHDIYIPTYRPTRTPIPLTKVDERIGTTAIQIDPSKIVGIVFNDTHDSPSTVTPPDDETQGIANHLIAFFEKKWLKVVYRKPWSTPSRDRFNCKRCTNRFKRF